jgi:hypothetical protein
MQFQHAHHRHNLFGTARSLRLVLPPLMMPGAAAPLLMPSLSAVLLVLSVLVLLTVLSPWSWAAATTATSTGSAAPRIAAAATPSPPAPLLTVTTAVIERLLFTAAAGISLRLMGRAVLRIAG